MHANEAITSFSKPQRLHANIFSNVSEKICSIDIWKGIFTNTIHMHPTLTIELFLATEKESAGKPYPVYMSNLAAAGVRSYHVSVDTHDRRIFSSAHDKHLHIPGKGGTSLTPADNFDVDKLKNALHRTQTGQTDYLNFMEEIADAGIHFYVADVENRKVSYHGKSPNAPYEEVVPGT